MLKISKSVKTESMLGISRIWGRERLLMVLQKGFFWGHKMFWNYSGEGCTILWIYENHWVVYFKRVNFTVYEICLNNKKIKYKTRSCYSSTRNPPMTSITLKIKSKSLASKTLCALGLGFLCSVFTHTLAISHVCQLCPTCCSLALSSSGPLDLLCPYLKCSFANWKKWAWLPSSPYSGIYSFSLKDLSWPSYLN